jgi:ubiquinone biosynthesis protein
MITPSQALRLIHINRVLVRHGLDEIIFATHLLRPLRLLQRLSPWSWFATAERSAPRGVRIRRALEDLGPLFVKFGQILSTRRDLLPEDVATELAKLQDQVPPFASSVARATIEAALEAPIDTVFAQFDDQPLASASIAQVHAALDAEGRQLVVKVLRPDVRPTIDRDVDVLYLIAGLAQRYWSEGHRLRPVEVVAEYEKTLHNELDLVREAANALQLRRNFEGSPELYIPEPVMSLTRHNVLVMERISGIAVSDIDALVANGTNLQLLAERGVAIFFTQVFTHNFFHADMHPGNIFVAREHPHDPQYIAVDFGIVGTLSPLDQKYLAGNFLAFFRRDYRRVAELHVDSGWVPAGTRVDEFESAIRTVCEPIFERPLKDISFGHLLLRLFQTARRFDMQVQPQLVLLQKTLVNIEGLGRQLYPDLDLWSTAKPFLERWMDEQLGMRAALRDLKARLPEWQAILPDLPRLAHKVLQQVNESQAGLERASRDLQALRRQVRRNNQRTVLAVVGTGLVVSAAVVYGLDGYRPLMLGGAPILSWVLGVAGTWMLLRTWLSD